ncbi:M20 metallopeptidase family protein [Streptobacillus canis]|uniref:M20 metallopeptidase family protein n=1 Tax=Streptobacillus canis TaxID=2678686 RepID=UPI0012E26D43|nr:amidohydrolase [Streptobacillus canis]
MNIKNEVEKYREFTINNRRFLHQHPEPSLKEYNTAKFIQDILKENNIEFVKVGETGTLAIIKGEKEEKNKTIFLRSDIDALEIEDKKECEYTSKIKGLSHACGHDGHATSLLTTCLILNKNRDKFSGTIKFAFQQAEEIGRGAKIFVKEGHLDDVDLSFGIHLDSSIDVGKVGLTKGPANASCDIFKIFVKGESAHVCAPHKGKDALVAASNIVVALQNIIARQLDPLKEGVVGIGVLNAGTRYNIIANDAYIEGTVRAFDYETREYILAKVEEIAKLTAKIHNCEAAFENYNAANPLINNDEAIDISIEAVKDLIGIDNIITNVPKTLGAEDFADYLAVTKGCFARIGSRNESKPYTTRAHHHQEFDIDEEALLVASSVYLKVALYFLNN